jgi:hypothetical protein
LDQGGALIVSVLLAKLVMSGLVPGIHVFAASSKEDVDGRTKPGHDEKPIASRTRDVRHARTR